MFNVGGCSELWSHLTGAQLKHKKPFESATKIEERKHYALHLGVAHQIKERTTKKCGNMKRNFLHIVKLIGTKDAGVPEGMMVRPWTTQRLLIHLCANDQKERKNVWYGWPRYTLLKTTLCVIDIFKNMFLSPISFSDWLIIANWTISFHLLIVLLSCISSSNHTTYFLPSF